jgi:hypothetical protein
MDLACIRLRISRGVCRHCACESISDLAAGAANTHHDHQSSLKLDRKESAKER